MPFAFMILWQGDAALPAFVVIFLLFLFGLFFKATFISMTK